MADNRTARSLGVGVLLLFLLGAAGCSSGGSARTDYFAARSISRSAQPGDGSIVALAPLGGDASWTASLTFAPSGDGGDLADSR